MKKYSPELEIREGTSDRAVVEEVIHRRIYLKNFILPFIKHNGLIIDIGAHIGSFTIQACSLLHPKVVLAIEPERDNFSHLIKNVAKARFKKIVHPIQVALWDSPAKKELYCQPANPSTHSLLPSWREWMTNPLRLDPNADAYEIQPVQTDTLDNVLKSVQLEHAKIEVIKIDVEGAEKQVLEGSSEALRRCNIMIGELHEAILSQDELRRQLVDFVVAIGEPSTSLRVRTFWAVRKAMLKNKTALREFRRAAKIASLEDTIWNLERETMSQNALAASMMDSLTNQLNLTHSSVSWRISAPIRWIGSILVPKPKSQVKLAENMQIAHVQCDPLGALQNPKVRDIFREIIEERLNNNLLSSYYRLGERVESYYIQGHRVSREELAGKIVDFLTFLPKNDPIDAARAFWSEFSFGGGNNAGVPIEVNSIESAYVRICQRTTGVVMIQDLLTQPNLSNGRIVDVGCLSNEFNMAILSQADCNGIRIQKAIGTDIVETTMALNDPRLAFRKQPSSKTLPLESEFADLAILKWALHHMTLDEVTSITREINRILKPGGKAVLIEALVGQDKELYREFLTECRQKDSWPEGPWQKVRRNITKRYFRLSLDEQKAVLALEDYYGHWLESLRTSMPLPFTYLIRDEIGYHFEVTGMNESTQLRRVFGFAPIIHQGPPSIRLVYEKQSAR
jgi:FkbM family methyltransferase